MAEVFTKHQTIVANKIIEEIAKRNALLDTKIGQPIRRVFVDPFASVLSDLYFQNFLTRKLFNLDEVIGNDLDNFARNFGFTRKQGTYASGIISCFREDPDLNYDYVVPLGTVFIISGEVGEGDLRFICSDSYTLTKGSYSVDVPVVALETGSNGNALVNQEFNMSPDVSGITGLKTNLEAFSGGTDVETDDEFRLRFKTTILKSVVGTEDHYENLCLDDSRISAVNVIEASEVWEEEVQLNGTTPDTLRFSNIYFDSETVSASETVLSVRSEDVGTTGDYVFDYIDGTVERTSDSNIPNGAFVTVRYEYRPTLSRGIGCVDVYIKGNDYDSATEQHIFHTGVDEYYLSLPPVTELPGTITVYDTPPVLLHETSDYTLSNETSGASVYYQNSEKDRSKIVFTGGTGTAYDGHRFTVNTYTYHSLTLEIQEKINTNKAITTDALVHFGNEALLDISLDVMLASGYDYDNVVASMEDALTEYIDDMGFVEGIQFSDIVEATHAVDGVDNVRVTSIDLTVGESESTETTDFYLDADQYPVFNSLTATRLSRNTWG